MQERLKQIKEHYPELDIIKINHAADHIHILVVILPRMSVSEVVRIIKTNTSKDIKKKFSFLKDVIWLYFSGQLI
jgi:REP element-mobilizing transposase RayT